jgi:hypothetical protein
MSVVRGFGLNGFKSYENVTYPSIVNLNFVVDSANGNGLGIRQLKSNGYVQNVFMHTSSTPGVNNGYTNPNPAVGYILVQFKNWFTYYLGGFSGFVSPPVTSGLTSTTAGNAYQIATLGTTTLAQWQTAGLPKGLTPTVNQSFIATATGSIGGSGTVYAPSVSGITSLEVVGDPNQSVASSSTTQYGGAWVLLQTLGATSSSVTTLIPTAPANNSVLGMCFRFDRGTVQIPDAAGQTGI